MAEAGHFSGQEHAGPELMLEPVYLYRNWRVSPAGALLSVTRDYLWHPGTNVAECYTVVGACSLEARRRIYGPAVHGDMTQCTCGFYAYGPAAVGAPDVSQYNVYGGLAGVIKASGEMVIGSRGARSFKAEVVALTMPWDRLPHGLSYRRAALAYSMDFPMVIRDMAYRYNAALFNSTKEMLHEFPLTDLETFRLPDPPTTGIQEPNAPPEPKSPRERYVKFKKYPREDTSKHYPTSDPPKEKK